MGVKITLSALTHEIEISPLVKTLLLWSPYLLDRFAIQSQNSAARFICADRQTDKKLSAQMKIEAISNELSGQMKIGAISI